MLKSKSTRYEEQKKKLRVTVLKTVKYALECTRKAVPEKAEKKERTSHELVETKGKSCKDKEGEYASVLKARR